MSQPPASARLARATAMAALVILPLAGPAAEPAKATLSEAEVERVLSHGPWPIPPVTDASNRASGQADAIVLGTAIFFDKRLSANGQMACAGRHEPERNWTDNLRRGFGTTEVDRNTPTLMNLRSARWFGWDGAANPEEGAVVAFPDD